jgi:hypothetical protein
MNCLKCNSKLLPPTFEDVYISQKFHINRYKRFMIRFEYMSYSNKVIKTCNVMSWSFGATSKIKFGSRCSGCNAFYSISLSFIGDKKAFIPNRKKIANDEYIICK